MLKLSAEDKKKALVTALVLVGTLIVYERVISPGFDFVAKKLNLPRIG